MNEIGDSNSTSGTSKAMPGDADALAIHADQRRHSLITREAGKPGLRGKVNAKCIECVVDPGSGGGTWRQQVEACGGYSCPLYSARPVSSPEKE